MKRRERFDYIHIALLLIGILLLGGFVVFVVLSLRTGQRSRDFTESMRTIDELIQSGDDETALKALGRESSAPRTAPDWLKYLKRLRVVTARLGAGGTFASEAEAAAAAFPGSEELSAVAVLALIDSGNEKKAGALAEKNLIGNEFRSVKVEAYLRAGIAAAEPAEGEMVYALLPLTRNPENFFKAAELSGEAGFYLNGALLLLENGRIEDAAEILRRPGIGSRHPYAAALALYDAGLFEESGRHVAMMNAERQLQPLVVELSADSLLRRGEYGEAEKHYRYLTDAYSGRSAIPYINGAFLLHRKEPWSGTSLLERGLQIFPKDLPILLDLVKALTALSRETEAADLLRRYEIFHPASPDLELLKLIADRGTIPVRGFTSSLWVLRNAHPQNRSINAILMGRLFSLSDHQALGDLLAGGPADGESETYRALLELQTGNPQKAFEAFTRVAEVYPDRPEAQYNRALILSARGELAAALEAFRKAEKLAGPAENRGLAEKASQKIVDALISLRSYPEAHAELKKILERDPGNPEAMRKLRKLEGLSES